MWPVREKPGQSGFVLKKKKQDLNASRRMRVSTLRDLQLPARVPQGGEEVQLDARLGAQVALQVLGLLLHSGQSGQQQVRVLLHAAVLPQSLQQGEPERESPESMFKGQKNLKKTGRGGGRGQEAKGAVVPRALQLFLHASFIFFFFVVWLVCSGNQCTSHTQSPSDESGRQTPNNVTQKLRCTQRLRKTQPAFLMKPLP